MMENHTIFIKRLSVPEKRQNPPQIPTKNNIWLFLGNIATKTVCIAIDIC